MMARIDMETIRIYFHIQVQQQASSRLRVRRNLRPAAANASSR